MSKRQERYDDEFRSRAVAVLQGAGWPDRWGALTQVSEQLNVPWMTLKGWATGEHNPPPAALVESKRIELSEAIKNEVDLILQEMNKARETATYRDLGVVFGILVDKLQLLNNEPTQNINQQIAFVRSGISTLPEHLASRTIDGVATSAEI